MEKILILDFGSQYTQLIARRVREMHVYCEIVPYNKMPECTADTKGIILSGSPFSVKQPDALRFDLNLVAGKLPVLGICYGAQLTADYYGGTVARSEKREYGKATLAQHDTSDPFFDQTSMHSQVWMSHGDTILQLPEGFEVLAGTENIPVAAFRSKPARFQAPLYGIQFHPEVYHSLEGFQFLKNFVLGICGCTGDWTPAHFVEDTVAALREQIGTEKVIMALSGGVDSTVAATLLHRAIGDRLFCFFVDNGLLRKDEFESVLDSYRHMGLNVEGVDAKKRFYDGLQGVTNPEEKRKIIGRLFIEVFEEESRAHSECHWLGQGTIYPDVIESVSVHGPSVTIKSHHNVGGLPEKLHLKIVEPLRMLFKDEVRRVGRELGITTNILNRHPFPGPGLGIRILGDITPEKVRLLQEADAIYINKLREHGLYDQVWQAGTILLPIQSVGVMGDERTYEQTIALRAVNSTDGMTAEWSRLPYDFLAEVSSEIINSVKGINRVVFDISTKPPATIEWE
ncbi:MAG: glutamine-hydrolyzing GMP synthase [Saprospiraceae bacterium]|jgi:GMP synthase (glutamine-hydrolysing)|nr:glutamine-hydrolyzing GMP synthase [Saprospiraceae bacterium]